MPPKASLWRIIFSATSSGPPTSNAPSLPVWASKCGLVTGGKGPDNFEKNASTKEALTAAWKGANEECTKAWSTMTDKGLAEMKTVGTNQVLVANRMFGNISHTNEHYGNLVTLFRLNKMVPPSTEAAQSMQKK